MKKNLIIFDKQDITKAGVLFLVSKNEGIENIYEVAVKEELIQILSREKNAIVLLDYTLSDFNGVDELILLSERFSNVNWILFSESLSTDFLKRILFGSNSFSVVLKTGKAEELLSAVKCALLQERFICNRVSNQLLSNNRPIENKQDLLLTHTEVEILKEIALGKTTKKIAAERNLSFHTVITHRKNIFRKLDVNNIYEATRYAIRAGIVDVAEYYI